MTEPRRILIVEDEPLIALLLEDILETIGRVAAGSAESVASALALVETESFDAAFLDVNLRGGTCWPVAEALAARGTPFVFVTGGSGDTIEPAFRDRPILAKPFTINSVERTLEALGA